MDLHAGAGSAGRHRRTRRLSVEPDPRLLRAPVGSTAFADRTPLLLRRAWRLPAPRPGRDLALPHPRTLHARTAGAGRDARRLRQGARDVRPRHLQGDRHLLARGGHARGAGQRPRADHGDDRGSSLRHRRRRRQTEAPRRPPLPRPVDGSDRRRRRSAQDPVDPPAAGRQPGAARLRRAQPPHLDRRDRPHQRHRRDDLARQGPHQDADRLLRCPGPRGPTRGQPRGRLGGRAGHRPAGGGETLRRQPRSRCLHRADHAGGNRGGVQGRPERRQRRHRRALHPGRRTPPAHRRRTSGRRQPQRYGVGDGRRQAHHRRADRQPDQLGSAARHDRGTSAQPDPHRLGGAHGDCAPGLHPRIGTAGRPGGDDPAQRQPRLRRHRRGPSRRRCRRIARRAHRRPRHRRHRPRLPRHLEAARRTGRRHRRSQCRTEPADAHQAGGRQAAPGRAGDRRGPLPRR